MQMALPPRRKLEMTITAAATTNKQTYKNPKVKRANKPQRQKALIPHTPNEWMNECRAIIISSNWFAWEIRFITNVQKCSDSKCKLPDIPSVMEENRRIKNKPERNRIDCQRPATWNPIQLRCDSNIYKRVVGASSFFVPNVVSKDDAKMCFNHAIYARNVSACVFPTFSYIFLLFFLPYFIAANCIVRSFELILNHIF